MKKTIVVSLVLMFALTGCFKKDEAPTEKIVASDKMTKTEKKLVDWFNEGKAVECVIKTEQGDMRTFSKGDKVRMEGNSFNMQNPEEPGYMINDGEWTYMWSGDKGTKMNNAKMDALGGEDEGMEEDSDEDGDDWEDSIEEWQDMGVAYDCKEANLKDEIFAEPKGVEFVDMTAMLGGTLDMADQFNTKFDENGEPEAMSMEDLEEMMKDLDLGQ